MEEKKKDRVGEKKQQLTMSSVLWPIWKNKMNLACLNIWFDVCFPFWLSFMCFVSNLCPIYILCIDELCQLFEIVKLLIIETEAQQQRERVRVLWVDWNRNSIQKPLFSHNFWSQNTKSTQERQYTSQNHVYSSENHDDKFVKTVESMTHMKYVCVWLPIGKCRLFARFSHDTYTGYTEKLATIWIINANSSILFWAASICIESSNTHIHHRACIFRSICLYFNSGDGEQFSIWFVSIMCKIGFQFIAISVGASCTLIWFIWVLRR